MGGKRYTAKQKAEQRVLRAAQRWVKSYIIGGELSRMNAPAYLCGVDEATKHELLKATTALTKLQGKQR